MASSKAGDSPPFASRYPRRPAGRPNERETPMMDQMMGGGMMWGMGLIGLLVVIVLLLGAAALVKYLFFSKRPGLVRANQKKEAVSATVSACGAGLWNLQLVTHRCERPQSAHAAPPATDLLA